MINQKQLSIRSVHLILSCFHFTIIVFKKSMTNHRYAKYKGSTTFDVGEENSLTSFFYVQIENK